MPAHRSSLRARIVVAVAAAALGVVGLVFAAVVGAHGALMLDLRGGLWDAGRAVLHGRSPYQPQFLARQVALQHTGGAALGASGTSAFSIPLYPAPVNLLATALALLPFTAAAVVYTVLSVGALLLGLWLLGVDDWRCHALTLISWPVLDGLVLGALGPWLVLGAGLAWHWRGHVCRCGLAVAAVVVAKLLPWPLAVWLLITRRYRALALAVGAGALTTLGAWAIVGLHTLILYPRMLAEAAQLQSVRSESLGGLLTAYGLPSPLATALPAGLAALVLGWAARGPAGALRDRRAFGLAILAALIASPLLWDHDMVLLVIPIAMLSPRLSWQWCLPAAGLLLTATLQAVVPPSPHETLALALPWVLAQGWLTVALGRRGEPRLGAGWSRVRPEPVTARIG